MSLKSKLLGFVFNTLDKHLFGIEPLDLDPDAKEVIREELGGHKNHLPPEFANWNPEEIHPYFSLNGEDYGWYLDPIRDIMVKIRRGSVLMKVTQKPDKIGRVVCYLPDTFIVVPEGELTELGWN